jgi:sugar/nucleoside kinase (ribokinase family)
MALNAYDILIPGHYFCDIIFSGIPGFPALGTELFTQGLTVVPGGIMNTAVSLKRLGVNVGWIGTFGNDFFSRFVLETARHQELDLSLVDTVDRAFKRVTVSLSYQDDRSFISYVDPRIDLMPRLFNALETALFKHLHFTGLVLDKRIIELIQVCHAKGIRVSMDCQHRDETMESPLVHEVIRNLDIFMPNAIEAQRLTGKNSVKEAASLLCDIVPYLVVKDGENGAHCWLDGQPSYAEAISVTEVFDTTGAGDVFNAGFLAAYLQSKLPETCLRWGNIAGGLSLRGYGGYTTAPTLTELEDYLW